MARKFTLTLLSDDPALQVAVAAMVRQHPQSFDLFCLASRDALMALRDAGTDLVLIDADTAGDVVASVAAAALVQPAPVTATPVKFSSQAPLQLLSRLSHCSSVVAKLPLPSRLMLGTPE